MVDFLKYKWLYFTISSLVLLIGLYSVVNWGFRFSIEFTGGTHLVYKANKSLNLSKVEKVLEQNKIEILDLFVVNQTINLKTRPLSDKQEKNLKKTLEKVFKLKFETLSSETVGPILGQETVAKTVVASTLAIIGILFYMSFAFKKFHFALAAVLAMLHDFFILNGIYSLLSHFYGAEFDTLFVTALLTTLSFSVHDTIVVFDKIREYRGESLVNIDYYANKALTETMIRSFNNSMTIVFMLLSLVLLGGSTIKFFALALLIGTIAGTYSSPFVATPIAVFLEKRKKR